MLIKGNRYSAGLLLLRGGNLQNTKKVKGKDEGRPSIKRRFYRIRRKSDSTSTNMLNSKELINYLS